MFSPELENLIQASLEDGVLEEHEKMALVKRATAEGVDLAELEIYINSILQRRQREQNQAAEARKEQREQERKEAFGRVCPNCGKQVPPMTLKCTCGFEFAGNSKVSSTIQVLSNKIEAINMRPSTEKSDGLFARRRNEYKKAREIADIINMCPVPNTKEDIIEFLTLACVNGKRKWGLFGTFIGRLMILIPVIIVICLIVSFILGGSEGAAAAMYLGIYLMIFAFIFSYTFSFDTLCWNKRADAWREKLQQVILKGRSMRGDSEFQKQLDYYENAIKQK